MLAPSTLTKVLSGICWMVWSNHAGASGCLPLNRASGPSLDERSFAESFMRGESFLSGRALAQRLENAGARHDGAVAAPDAALDREEVVVDADDFARTFHPVA